MKGKIFNAQEVQAIISGNKTQFREVKVQPNSDKNPVKTGLKFTGIWGGGAKESRRECPYQVGQKIFVKEKFWVVADNKILNKSNIFYQADGKIFGIWTPAQHMKQEQSRLTLQIKEVRVERLQDISEKDCWKEGLEEFADYQDSLKICQMAKKLGECIEDPKPTFAVRWNSTHKKPEEKFEASPFVWCVSF